MTTVPEMTSFEAVDAPISLLYPKNWTIYADSEADGFSVMLIKPETPAGHDKPGAFHSSILVKRLRAPTTTRELLEKVLSGARNRFGFEFLSHNEGANTTELKFRYKDLADIESAKAIDIDVVCECRFLIKGSEVIKTEIDAYGPEYDQVEIIARAVFNTLKIKDRDEFTQ